MSQCQAILQHLESGETLTPLQAFNLYGTLALHSRIAELRKRGHLIDCDLIAVLNGKHVGCYSLIKVPYG
jgi:hypothetical protein